MGRLLNCLRKHPDFYTKLKKVYGYTLGLWPLKRSYLKYVGIWNGKRRLKLLDQDEGNKILEQMIRSKRPFMLARYGSSEFRAIANPSDFQLVCFYSGFFPKEEKLLPRFREVYRSASKKADILIVWNYQNHFIEELKLLKQLPSLGGIVRGISPTPPHNSWVNALEGKRVLIVHPFKNTIELQMKKREKIGILPMLKSVEVIPAVQTIAGNTDPRFKDWFEALDYMKKEIDKKDFDVAIIGCGAYGLPLAAHVKSLGKQALHLAGATQLLFGIKGKRWDKDPRVRYTEDWISPLTEDTPKSHKKIEGGCYW